MNLIQYRVAEADDRIEASSWWSGRGSLDEILRRGRRSSGWRPMLVQFSSRL